MSSPLLGQHHLQARQCFQVRERSCCFCCSSSDKSWPCLLWQAASCSLMAAMLPSFFMTMALKRCCRASMSAIFCWLCACSCKQCRDTSGVAFWLCTCYCDAMTAHMAAAVDLQTACCSVLVNCKLSACLKKEAAGSCCEHTTQLTASDCACLSCWASAVQDRRACSSSCCSCCCCSSCWLSCARSCRSLPLSSARCSSICRGVNVCQMTSNATLTGVCTQLSPSTAQCRLMCSRTALSQYKKSNAEVSVQLPLAAAELCPAQLDVQRGRTWTLREHCHMCCPVQPDLCRGSSQNQGHFVLSSLTNVQQCCGSDAD